MALEHTDDAQILGANGGSADIEDGALLVNMRSRFKQAWLKGDAYCWAALNKNPAQHDTVIGLENNDTARDLYIWMLSVGADTTSDIHVFAESGLTVAGTTAIPGANLNRIYSRLPKTTCVTDETGNGQQAAAYTKGITHDWIVADVSRNIMYKGCVCLPNDHMIGVDLGVVCGASSATIWGWFEDR